MQMHEDFELDSRELVLSQLNGYKDKYFNFYKEIAYCGDQMIYFIDNLLENLSVLISRNGYPAALQDEPRQIKALMENSRNKFRIDLANLLDNISALSEVIVIVREDFNDYWWTIAESAYCYIDKLKKLHLEFVGIQDLFKQMAQRYIALSAF